MIYIFIIICVFLISFGQLSIKYGANLIQYENMIGFNSETISKLLLNNFVIFGILMWLIAAALWVYILTQVSLTKAYPFMTLPLVIVMLLSALIFKEKISYFQWFGSILIFFGVYLISIYKP